MKLRYLLIIGCALLAWSCAKASKDAKPAPAGIEKTYERGPVTLLLRTDRNAITTADTLKLTLEARTDEGQDVEMPDPEVNAQKEKKIGEFLVVHVDDARPQLAEAGKVSVTRTFTLEPFLAGDYKIPPLKIRYKKKGESEKHDFETEEATISVTSVLPSDTAQAGLQEIAPPVRLPRTLRSVLPWIAAPLAALLAGTAWWLYRKRCERLMPPPPPRPPYDIALEALDRLLAEHLLELGDYKQFYFRVSDILRRFIEHRFGLHAPERTTEEFLAELDRSKALPERHQMLLQDFLDHCDLVKFAKHEPESEEISRTVESCRDFVVETREADRRARMAAEGAA